MHSADSPDNGGPFRISLGANGHVTNCTSSGQPMERRRETMNADSPSRKKLGSSAMASLNHGSRTMSRGGVTLMLAA